MNPGAKDFTPSWNVGTALPPKEKESTSSKKPLLKPSSAPKQVVLGVPSSAKQISLTPPAAGGGARQISLAPPPQSGGAKQISLAPPAASGGAKQVSLGESKQVVLGGDAKQTVLGGEAKQVLLGGAAKPVVGELKQAEAPGVVVKEEVVKKVESKVVVAAQQVVDDEPTEDEAVVKDEDPRDHLNCVFVGHVDAGKSTLCGSILYATGVVDKRTIEKYEKEAKERNRESWYLAYVMDQNEEERARGKTVEVGTANFETQSKRFTILDAPGHKNYVPAMIAGASHADVAVLVISSRKGEFESGFEKQGQTREHSMLCFTLGIRKLIVAINKLDDPSVNWDRERYDEIEKKISPFLKSCGYKVKKDVIFMPIAALTGAGVLRRIDAEKECKWALEINEGKSLVDLLESINMEERNAAAGMRLSVLDSYVDRGVWTLGKIEAGTLKRGMTVCVSPTAMQAKVAAILIDENSVRSAKPGENVVVKLAGLTDESDCRKGYVLSDERLGTKTFTATIKLLELLEHRSVFTAGYTAVLHAHTIISDCTVSKILWKHDPETGKPIKERCTFAKDGDVITVRLECPLSIAVEAFEKTPQLGRITLRDEGKSIAIGKIKKLEG